MDLNLSSLNKQQHEAVTTAAGPVLILAGAGSGKTRVLTHRIAYIMQQKLAHPDQILAVTFTNKAAGEMKERVSHLLGENGSASALRWMGTFHSVCVKILKRDGTLIGLDRNFTIYDSNDQRDIVKQAMAQLDISIKEVNPRTIHSYISSAKNEFITPAQYKDLAQGYFQELVADIYPKYQKILQGNNAVDFDDLLVYTTKLLQDYPEIRQKYQKMFKYIMVDEYQDTNHVQYRLVRLLAEEHRNLCVVGDDDQSIYAFRGATIKNILNFERDYPDAKVIKLEQNYRSTKVILDAAYNVVSKNSARTDKKLWTDQGEGDQIMLHTAENESEEAKWVASMVKDLVAQGTDFSEIAVLYRTNAQSRALEEGFLKKAVRYRIVGGQRFYERKEIKDILAYLRAIFNPRDDKSFVRIVNVPRRGIGGKTVEILAGLAGDANKSMTEFLLDDASEVENKKLQMFGQMLGRITTQASELNVVDLINYVLKESKYIEMLEDGTSENEARIENIKELLSVAAKFHELGPQESLEMFLEEISLLEGDPGAVEIEGGQVTLMTIHAAKGLEFEHVFVVGVEEGLFPHSRVATDLKELEEERRLAYVAITRAKHNLYLVHADSRVYFGSRQNNMLSRFVDDIPTKLLKKTNHYIDEGGLWEEADSGWEDDGWSDSEPSLQLKIGDRVKHEYFGVGKVKKLTESTIEINFGPVYGTRELSREYAPLQPLG